MDWSWGEWQPTQGPQVQRSLGRGGGGYSGGYSGGGFGRDEAVGVSKGRAGVGLQRRFGSASPVAMAPVVVMAVEAIAGASTLALVAAASVFMVVASPAWIHLRHFVHVHC